MSRSLLGIVMIAGVVAAAGCGEQRANVKKDDTIPVKVVVIKPQQFKETIEYVGNIKASDEVFVYPRVSGKVIEKLREEGSLVRKNDPIMFIDRDEVGLKYEKAPVDSPLDGTVGKVLVDLGANVTPQSAVALLVNMEAVKIDLEIPERYLPDIQLEQVAQIRVDGYPKEIFSGAVTQISPIIDVATRAATVQITVPNKEYKLKSGMFARVELILRERDNISVVLKEAIMGKEPNQYVYIVENKKAALRKITVGTRQDQYYEIKEGLKNGEAVVIVGQQRLYENAPVIVEE